MESKTKMDKSGFWMDNLWVQCFRLVIFYLCIAASHRKINPKGLVILNRYDAA